MKKIFALVLALLMVLSMTACGAKKADSDAAYIEGNGKMVIGYTIYEPMNYFDENGDFTGFDTEFAKAVCEKLGVEPEFVEIVWDTKEIELNAKSIDCIWNGMTITEERQETMSISLPYVKNAQVVVVKADSAVASTADLIGMTVVAEIGSAGEAQIQGEDANADLAQAEYVGLSKQADCLLELEVEGVRLQPVANDEGENRGFSLQAELTARITMLRELQVEAACDCYSTDYAVQVSTRALSLPGCTPRWRSS